MFEPALTARQDLESGGEETHTRWGKSSWMDMLGPDLEGLESPGEELVQTAGATDGS